MTQEVKLKRVQCNYQPENARFLLDCDFSKQYDHYYRKRLEKTRPFVEFNCRSKWDPTIPIYNLSEVASFSIQSHSDEDSDLGSSSSLSPPPSTNRDQLTSGQITPGNYKFAKRLRKLSETTSPLQKSSTQQQGLGNFSASPPDELFTSPIIGRLNAQQILSSECSPGIRRPKDSRRPECIVIGTIFKRMKLQPDVVEELSKGNFHVKCEKYLGHYTSQDDTLVLEDTEESIQLVGNINPKRFVTGIVVALLGVSIDDGSQFLVYDVCFAEPNRQILYDDLQAPQQLPPEITPKDTRPMYLMAVSGLGFHHEMSKNSELTKALQDMIDFVWGGGRFEDDSRSSQVARVLVLGNNLHADRFDSIDDDDSQSGGMDDIAAKMKKSRQVKPYSESLQATKHMDDFFSQLSKTINVDVMPGPSDPSSHLMPQQPFHPCMFPKSCVFSTFNCAPNPHHAIYNNKVEVLATSGQNVDIISKFSGLSDPIEIMKCHILWGNSAPSAPDNLYCVPYEDDDPYVIDFIPDVYIAGCQKKYQTDRYFYTSSESKALQEQHLQDSMRSGESQIINVTPQSERASTSGIKATSGGCSAESKSGANNGGGRRARDALLPDGTPRVAGELGDRRDTSQMSENDSTSAPAKESTLLITIPEFCETFSCVLINLNSLESELLSFK